jgi:hypothetical protein
VSRPPSNDLLHAQASQHRLLVANDLQGQTILSLIAALRELHAVMSERSSGMDDKQRLDLAKAHVIRTLARHGTFPAKAGAYARGR